MIFIRLKTSSQIVNRVERNELESYTESAPDTAPRLGRGGTRSRHPRDAQVPGPPLLPRLHAHRARGHRPPLNTLRPGSPSAGRAWLPAPRPPGTLGSGGPSSRGALTPQNVRPAPAPLDAAVLIPQPPGTARNKRRARSPCSLLPFQFSPDLRWN